MSVVLTKYPMISPNTYLASGGLIAEELGVLAVVRWVEFRIDEHIAQGHGF